MADLKKIIDLPELTAVTGDETVVGTSDDGATVRIPVKNISGASLDELANLSELEEAVGDETVIGVSNGSVVRIPVDAIGGGGSSEPILLRYTATNGSYYTTVYNDGSSIDINDIKNALLAGVPIYCYIADKSLNAVDTETFYNAFDRVTGVIVSAGIFFTSQKMHCV